MGITARGAWESVRRHARVLGKNADSEPLTTVGIGDMSGDVFGNGMLRSRHLRLVAAFDHRHIFIDPDPDPEESFAERKRLFELPRSSWADYDTRLISAGGGVYSRADQVDHGERRRAGRARHDGGARHPDRADPRDPDGTGRPALERRHRHLREGEQREPRRRRRSRQRRRPCRRLGAALPDGRRRRQPRVHPARPRRVRTRRRPDLQRRDRQLGRCRLQRPRGQHQDPARRCGGRRRAALRRAQRSSSSR